MIPSPSLAIVDSIPHSECHEVWDHLDQFLLQLQAATDVSRRIRATLEMVRRATHAGAVLLCSGSKHTVSEFSGPAGATSMPTPSSHGMCWLTCPRPTGTPCEPS